MFLTSKKNYTIQKCILKIEKLYFCDKDIKGNSMSYNRFNKINFVKTILFRVAKIFHINITHHTTNI